MKNDNHVGETYGIYTLIESLNEKDKYGHYLYKGKCKICGYETVRPFSHFSAPSAITNNCKHLDRNGNYLFGRYMNDLTNSFPGYSYDFAKLSDRDFYGKIKYIRVSGTIDSLDKYMFVEGSTYPESYIPYSATYEIVGKIRKGVEALSKMLIEENCFPLGYTLINEALNNIAIGKNAMKNATTDNGAYNVAVGDNSLVNNTGDGTDDTGNYNVAIGYAAMKNKRFLRFQKYLCLLFHR